MNSLEEPSLQGASPLQATLFTRPGCHLCEEAKAVLLPLLRAAGGTLQEINVDGDEGLRARYGNEVPVVFLGSRKVAKLRVDPQVFRKQLAAAASQR